MWATPETLAIMELRYGPQTGRPVAYGETVKLGDVEIGPPRWGNPIPVDPGDIVITASAPGARPWHAAMTLARGQALSIDVTTLQEET